MRPLIRSSSSTRKQHQQSIKTYVTIGFVGSVLLLLGTWFAFLMRFMRQDRTVIFRGRTWHFEHDSPFARFRRYPNHRYYHLDAEHRPDFLVTDYIHGEWPTLLVEHHEPTKLWVNQSDWHSSSSTWPFADGTNPSVLTMERLLREAPKVAAQIHAHYPSAVFVVTICMTNSQCTWKDTAETKAEFEVPQFDLPDLSQSEPNTVRTLLQLLDSNFLKLDETTIFLERDAAWGRRHRKPATGLHMPALDDARLFVHNHEIFVSYREGPSFGYESQVLNPIHLDVANDYLEATIRASETSSFCCGRNMALMEDVTGGSDLFSLTWVDPVTVELVDTTPLIMKQKKKKQQRRLAEEKQTKKSHIHGTNAFMVRLPNNSYLGVAHYHRPNGRKANEYARFGHHYTHAFYTVAPHGEGGSFVLTTMSSEFVLPSVHKPEDADIIQFISGLELLDDDQIVLAYGINDCEAAMTTLDLSTVEGMLKPVATGKQVIDLMEPLR